MNNAYRAGDFELEKRLRQALAALRAQITFVSLAGNMIEDKADTGGQIPLAVNMRPRALDEQTPHTESKFLLLFARIVQYYPSLAIFLARYGRYDSRTVGKNPLVRAAMIDVKVR